MRGYGIYLIAGKPVEAFPERQYTDSGDMLGMARRGAPAPARTGFVAVGE
jgi:hypothetical protein